MRKVLSFVLVLAMILGSVSMAFAASPTDVVGKDSEEAVNVLMEFGVVTGYPDGSFKPAGIVTRAEMAAFVIRALGLNPTAPASTQFKDVPVAHWASKYVAYATNLGIILGRTATVFDPEATVSYDEAVTMLVRALGYTEASLNGTYPAAYVSKAMALGILGSMPTGTAGANRGDIAKLVFNTLPLPIGKVGTDNIWVAAADPSDNMMKRLGANEYLTGAAFLLTDSLADAAVANVREHIGAWVTAYANDDDDIIAINTVESVFLTGEFDATVTSIGAFNKPDFETSDKVYNVNKVISASAIKGYFLNGEKVDAFEVTENKTYTIAAKVSGLKITEIYSISEWKADPTDLFEEGDLEDEKLLTADFKLTDNDEIDLKSFALLGATSLADINEDDVVYVYVGGANDTITRIEVGTETVSGKVTKIVDGNKYTIDGVQYEESGYASISISVKDEVKLYLDYAGKIFKSEKMKGEADKLAVVLDVANGAAGLNGNTPKLELFLADGTSAVFEADSEEIDDASVIGKTTKIWDQSLVTTGALMKYSLDSNGVIDGLTTAALTSVVSGGAMSYDVSTSGYMDGFKIASDAVIFTIKDITAKTGDADDYGIRQAKDLFGVDDVVAMYETEDGLINLIVMEDSATSADEVFGVYDSANAETSADPGWEVRFLVDGSPVWYGAKVGVKTDAVTSTGLFLMKFDTDGYVKSLTAAAFGADVSTLEFAASGDITILNKVATVTYSAVTPGGVASLYSSTDKVSLADGYVVYKLDSNKWVKGTSTDLKAVSGRNVMFFDTVGKDKVADIVLIK